MSAPSPPLGNVYLLLFTYYLHETAPSQPLVIKARHDELYVGSSRNVTANLDPENPSTVTPQTWVYA